MPVSESHPHKLLFRISRLLPSRFETRPTVLLLIDGSTCAATSQKETERGFSGLETHGRFGVYPCLMRMAGIASLVLGGCLLARARDVRAADLPGARLEVTRSTNAGECRDEAHFAGELRSRMTASQVAALELLALHVGIDREGPTYVATIHVDGRKQGVRTLRADGPSCEPLHDALMVALLLLLDEDPTKPPAPLAPTVTAPPPASPPPPSQAPVAPASASRRTGIWLSAGGALTHGLPDGWWFAATGEAIARIDRFDLALGGFWAPQRSVPIFAGDDNLGDILLRLAGARARGCYAFVESEGSLRVSGCALGIVSSLTGQGREAPLGVANGTAISYFWALVGPGADAHIALSSRIGLGITGGSSFSTVPRGFFIKDQRTIKTPPLTRYDSDTVTAWAGLDLRVRIW